MKLGWNLAAGLANSLWSAAVILGTVPLYLRFLGIEAYGLIGFFAAMQALLTLLDLGLAPTINREVARSSDQADQSRARDLLHTLAFAFWAIAAAIGLVTFAAAPLIGNVWLNTSHLPRATVVQAVAVMGLIIALRFPSGLYQGALLGAQRMVVSSVIEIASVTFASVGALIVLAFVSPTVQAFFLWQALAGLVHVVALRAAAWRVLRSRGDRAPRFDRSAFQRIWRFSAGMGLTAILGAVFLQSDKIILSRIVTLAELGRYTLAGMAARCLYLFVAPAFAAVYPRLTALHAAGDAPRIQALYETGTRLLAAVVFPLAVFVAILSTDLFTLWTGDAGLARSLELTVALLLAGTALNAVMHFPYALQLAHGRSDLPMMINLALLVVFAPLLAVLALKYGIEGAAAAWAILNALYLFLGAWVTHRVLMPGVGWRWLARDVGAPLLIALLVVGGGGYVLKSVESAGYLRLIMGVWLMAIASIIVLATNGRRQAGLEILANAMAPSETPRRFFAQFGEDRILARLFPGRTHGVCVEVGANNGVDGSPTLLFERLGWDCVLVEPNPDLCAELRARRRARLFECAASGAEGSATLHVAVGAQLAHAVSALGGEGHGQEIQKRHGYATRPVQVPTRRLDQILEEAALGGPIDFISIDVEGHELELLSGFTPERWRPSVLIIEDNGAGWHSPVSRRLAEAGYVRFKRTGVNDWYAHRSNEALAGRFGRMAYYPSMLGARCLMAGLRTIDRVRRIPMADRVWTSLSKAAA